MNTLSLANGIAAALNKMAEAKQITNLVEVVDMSPVVEAILEERERVAPLFRLFMAGQILFEGENLAADQIKIIEDFDGDENTIIDYIDGVQTLNNQEDSYTVESFLEFINQKFNP